MAKRLREWDEIVISINIGDGDLKHHYYIKNTPLSLVLISDAQVLAYGHKDSSFSREIFLEAIERVVGQIKGMLINALTKG